MEDKQRIGLTKSFRIQIKFTAHTQAFKQKWSEKHL